MNKSKKMVCEEMCVTELYLKVCLCDNKFQKVVCEALCVCDKTVCVKDCDKVVCERFRVTKLCV